MIKAIILTLAFSLSYCTLPLPVFGCEDEIDTYADDHNCYFTLESCDE